MYNHNSILYCNKDRPTQTNAPDGYLYVLSSEDDGAVLYKISDAKWFYPLIIYYLTKNNVNFYSYIDMK